LLYSDEDNYVKVHIQWYILFYKSIQNSLLKSETIWANWRRYPFMFLGSRNSESKRFIRFDDLQNKQRLILVIQHLLVHYVSYFPEELEVVPVIYINSSCECESTTCALAHLSLLIPSARVSRSAFNIDIPTPSVYTVPLKRKTWFPLPAILPWPLKHLRFKSSPLPYSLILFASRRTLNCLN
jgi:hypothetical protein